MVHKKHAIIDRANEKGSNDTQKTQNFINELV